MRPRPSFAFAVTLLTVLLFACGDGDGPVPATTPATARFEESPCATPLPDGQPAAGVRCGFVVVPEDRAVAESGSIRLAVMVLKATRADHAPDPIVYISGGPGISALQTDLPNFGDWLDIPLQEQRDIVIFDQRGTGLSQPSLACPGEHEDYLARLGQHLTVDEQLERSEESALACRDRLVADGVHLGAYRTEQAAADIRDVMTALGHSEWNIYAFSYGTRVALTAMRDNPASIRAVVLDSPTPLGGEAANRAAKLQAAVEGILSKCAEDDRCNAAYPGALGLLDEALRTLDGAPATVETSAGVHVVMTAPRFIDALFRRFSVEGYAQLPVTLTAVAAGQPDALLPSAEALADGWTWVAGGALISTSCADERSFATPEDLEEGQRGVRPEFVDGVRSFTGLWPISPRFCEQWGVTPAATGDNSAHASTVPALIFSGAHDAGEPPANGKQVSAALPGSHFFEVPNSAHGQGFTYPLCVGAIAAAFLDAPSAVPSITCLDSIPPIDWQLP